MNKETEILSQLKTRLQQRVSWSQKVEELVAIYGHLNSADIASLDNEQLWKLWTATKFAETGTPSLPNPTPEQWPGIRKMTQLLCDRKLPLGERFIQTRLVYRDTFSAEQVQLPVILRTLLILEAGCFGTVATKSHLDPLLKWAGKPEMDYRNPGSITSALENIQVIIEAWSAKVESASSGDRACIPWHLCKIIQENMSTPEASTVLSTLPQTFEAILDQYLTARTSTPFAGNHPVCQLFEDLKSAFTQIPAIQNRPNLLIKWSAGQGNWSRVPWLVFMDGRETTSTMRGVYCVYLFRQDMSGVYLTYNQGVTDVLNDLGQKQGEAALRNRARTLRQSIEALIDQGFSLKDTIDLKADRGLGSNYEISTIAEKFYAKNSVPTAAELVADLEAVLQAYDQYLKNPVSITTQPLESKNTSFWIFQGNPKLFNIDNYVKSQDNLLWSVRQHGSEVKTGDQVLLWRAGERAGVIAICTVTSPPENQPDDSGNNWLKPNGGSDLRCSLKVEERFVDRPVPRELIKYTLPDLQIIKAAQGTNFSVTKEEYSTILKLQIPTPDDKSFPALLRRYYDEKIIFNSSAQKQRYTIANFDLDGVDVERLDASEPQRITFKQSEKLIQNIISAGSLNFISLHGTAAVRNTILQAEPLALTADQKIIFLADNPARLKNFLEVLDHLQMSNPLYKPAMLFCVLDGINSGELKENRIPFDWIAPRFIQLLKLFGKDVNETQAAHPFYHLANDLIWLHAISDPNNMMQDGGDGPAAARKKINYALLKETYWNLLQDPASRLVVHNKLETLLMPTPEEFLLAAETAINETGFQHPPGLVRRFLAALAAKPFVIFTGNSGTGKTKLAQLLAHWMAGDADETKNRYAVVPVGADWTDNRNVVGFVNHLRKDDHQNPLYQSTSVLDLLLRATADPARPYFLILDEMNLSHVERYFSDFLSAMESKKTIPLHNEIQTLRTPSGDIVPRGLAFPENLFVIGTVNVDETTYMFSPKVLDRANVLEFRIGAEQAKAFLSGSILPVKPAPPALGIPLTFLNLSRRARGLVEPTLALPTEAALITCRKNLQHLFELLHVARLEFAFRTIAEITRYLQVDFQLAPDKTAWLPELCLDAQILQKILPKLYGSRRRLEAILIALATYCEKLDLNASQKPLQHEAALNNYPPATPPNEVAFPLSHTKLLEMLEAVRRDQFVSFIQ